jgi:hypothetical protein
MAANRRNFLIGTAGAAFATGGVAAQPNAVRVADPQHSFEMPRGMTLLNMRRDGGYRLGVKTNKGILDVVAAAQALNLPAPTDMDDLLQNGKGGVLKASSSHFGFWLGEGLVWKGFGWVLRARGESGAPQRVGSSVLRWREHFAEAAISDPPASWRFSTP